MNTTRWIGAVILIVMALSGCGKMYIQDESGTVTMTPEASAAYDTAVKVGEVISGVGSMVSIWWPPAALIAGAVGGIVATAKNLKPKLQEAKNRQDLYYRAGESTAIAIEKFKEKYPQSWKQLEEILVKNHGPEIENVFRGFRGLPPKQ